MKLLHERLEEYANDLEFPNRVQEREGSVHFCDMLREWAEEIERFYIPRPRFEDGEPVQFGDSAKRDFGTADAENIDKFVFYVGGTVDVCGSNGHFSTSRNGASLKRLDPKVLDADGVEIKVGDTVYILDTCSFTHAGSKEHNCRPMKVEHLPDYSDKYCAYKGAIFIYDETLHQPKSFSGYIKPEHVIHEKPVFDADGVRICKGDTVWHANTQWTVMGIVYHDGEPWVQLDNTNNNPSCSWQERTPSRVTHREPDSFERLRDEVREWIREGRVDEDDLNVVADRLTALIERGA